MSIKYHDVNVGVTLGGSGGGTERNLFIATRYPKYSSSGDHRHQNINITDRSDGGIIINGSFTSGDSRNELHRYVISTEGMIVFSELYMKIECDDPRVYATIQKNGGDWSLPANINNQSSVLTLPVLDYENGYLVGFSLHPDNNNPFNNVNALIKIFAD